jgi:hypothetical protein
MQRGIFRYAELPSDGQRFAGHYNAPNNEQKRSGEAS